MAMRLDYTAQFAGGIWLPFRAESRIGRLICAAGSTEAEFKADPENWLSEQRVRYSDADMASLWRMIEAAKRRVQALWLVATGGARSLIAAYAAMGCAYGA